MTEKIEKQKKEKRKLEKAEKQEKHKPNLEEERSEMLVRIHGYDIPGSKNVYAGLTRIKGISWAVSNAVCLKLDLAKSKKVSELTKADIAKIEKFLENPEMPDFMKNRRLDNETGKTEHYLSSDLDIKKEFDIKRLKEIRSYRGLRHALKLPSRGQRTRSHFRNRGITLGVKKKKA